MPTHAAPRVRAATVAAAVVALAGTAATAVPPPGPPAGTNFTVQILGGGAWGLNNLPTPPWTPAVTGVAGQWHAEGRQFASQNGWLEMQWAIDVHEDPFVSQSFTITNTSAVVQTYTMTTMLPASVAATSQTFGAITGTLTNNALGAAAVGTVAGVPLYQAIIDGSTYMTLLNDPYGVVTGPLPGQVASIGPVSFGPLSGQPGVASSIAVTNVFTLTPGDTLQLTSTFYIETELPAPASAGVLGVAGVLAARRRRR